MSEHAHDVLHNPGAGPHAAHAHDEHLEVYPESGITETNGDFYPWMLPLYLIGFAFLTGYTSNQWWNQKSDLPLYGPGWEVRVPNQDWTAPSARPGYAHEYVLGPDEPNLPPVNGAGFPSSTGY